MEYKAYSERLCYARLDAHPTPLSITSAYSPTEDGEETEKDAFYSLLIECLKAIPRKDILLIGGDLNSKLGKQLPDEEKNIGKFAIGEPNNNRQRLSELIVSLDLVAINTTIQKKRRKLAKGISNDRKNRNQIDYILTNRRWRSAINDTTIRTDGVMLNSDHRLLISTVKLKLRNYTKKLKICRYNVAALRVPETAASYQRELSIQLENNPVSGSVENARNNLAQSLQKAAEKALAPPPKRTTPGYQEKH